jgi:hypothetical protein
MAVEITTTFFVDEMETLRRDDDRGILFPPRLHGREGMPDVLDVCTTGR